MKLADKILVPAALVFSIMIFMSGCFPGGEPKSSKPNIIFIIADDLSWEHLGAYGFEDINTPHIDRLAKEGVLFENTFVSTSSCTASRASILTGRNGFELEQGACLWGYLPQKFVTYTDLLKVNGYAVGGTGKGWGPGFLMDREENPVGKMYNEIETEPYAIPGENVWISKTDYAANFENFLADAKDQPFCFWMGTYEPHRGYAPGLAESQGRTDIEGIEVPEFLPDDSVVKKDINDYLFEVEHIHRQLGELMDILEKNNKLENTLIVFTSDNGMPFPRAKATLYDYGTRMPLIVWWGENIKGGRTITDLISLTDVAPTFLDASGFDIPKEMSGKSFLPHLHSDESGRIDETRNKVFVYRERHSWCCPGGETFASRGIRTDDYLLIWNARPDIAPGDVDGSPSKAYMVDNKKEFPELYELTFGVRSEYELYNLHLDQCQMNSLASSADHSQILDSLKTDLFSYLEHRQDQRISGNEDIFTNTPYFGFLFELGMLNWSEDKDGRRYTEDEIIDLLQEAYKRKSEQKKFRDVAKSENWF